MGKRSCRSAIGDALKWALMYLLAVKLRRGRPTAEPMPS